MMESKLLKVVEMLRSERSASAASAVGDKDTVQSLQKEVAKLSEEAAQAKREWEDSLDQNATLVESLTKSAELVRIVVLCPF